MSTIKLMNYDNIINSIEVYCFGWSKDELADYIRQYQSKYYGSSYDGQFEITDDQGNIYYAIFRTAADNEWFVYKPKDYLLFKDQNRVLLNIGGKLYHYLISEKKILDNISYEGIICNDFGEANSPYFHSITSSKHELMIIVDREGVSAINWDNILWKQLFDGLDCGHLALQSIDEDYVYAMYDDYIVGKFYHVVFNLQNGKYEMKLA